MAFIDNKSKASYLCARDPSILSWSSRKNTWKIRANYNDLFQESLAEHSEEEETAVTKDLSEECNNLEVILRIKNGDLSNLYSINDNLLYANIPKTSHFAKYARGEVNMIKQFTFSKIFSPLSTQEEIFIDVVKPKLLSFINGTNETVLSYGCSGSGKTYTVMGTETDPGIIPRALEYVFASLPDLPKVETVTLKNIDRDVIWSNFKKVMNGKPNRFEKSFHAMQSKIYGAAILDESVEGLEVGIWISFVEIYNEQMFDLFEFDSCEKSKPKLSVCTNKNQVFIKNLKHVYVSSAIEAYELLQLGMEKLNYASTGLNKHSSRSHCIFTIKLLQTNSEDESIKSSVINFCDLAGSERSSKTHNVGKRLKESNNINTSLMVLGRCISTIRNNQKNKENTIIPFRESKLTQLFQKALSGFEDVTMLVNINPTKDIFDESMRVLMFSAIASEIILEHKEELKGRFSLYMQQKNVNTMNSKKEENLEITNLRKTLQDVSERLILVRECEEERRTELLSRFEKVLVENNQKWQRKVKALELDLKQKDEQLEDIPAKRARLDNSVICLDETLPECSNCENMKEILDNASQEYKELKAKYEDIYHKYITISEKYEDSNYHLDVVI